MGDSTAFFCLTGWSVCSGIHWSVSSETGGQFAPKQGGQFQPEQVVSLNRIEVVNFTEFSSGNVNDPIMTDLPDSLDVVIVFPNFTPPESRFWTQLRDVYVPNLHARGIKVIITGGLGIPTGVPHNKEGYRITADKIMKEVVTKYNLDGYDIDVESEPSGTTLEDMVGVYTALADSLGPKSNSGRLLTFDTNKTGSNSVFRRVYNLVSYVWLQAYGRGANTLQSTWSTFAPYIKSEQFVVGFSFYEENGFPNNYWDDVIYPQNGTGRAYDYARWQPTTGTKGGVVSYALDRDAPLKTMHDNTIIKPNFRVSNDLIKIMNPALAVVRVFQHCDYGGWSASLVPGNYSLSQLAAKGISNDQVSSIKVPSGYTVVLYEHDNYGGKSISLTSDRPCLINNSFNDLASSIKIVKN